MSMLAERRVKQKWSLNPRGKAWSEDSNKFGQKLMEKMGWSKGKGLGAKEDGIVDHVKISYKNDSKGMGYKESNDQWTEHDSNFTALLESLSGEKPQEGIQISSLEQKSQSSKVRVHYKKFTRGKDLSRCSEKDLANIFGKRSLKETPQPVENKDMVNEVKEEILKDSFTHNRGSMVDYFKKKLPNYGKSYGCVVGSNGVLKKGSDSEEDSYVGFGFKSEKKRKSMGEAANGTPTKRIKEEAESMNEDKNGLRNPAFDPMFNDIEVQKHILTTIKEENEDAKDEEMDRKKKKDVNLEKSFENNKITYNGNDSSSVKKKTKKKKKQDSSVAIENPNFNESDTIEVEKIEYSLEVDISADGKKTKKKKKKQDPVAIVNPNFNENDDENDSCLKNDTFEVKRKKKKEKSAIDNPNFDITIEEDCQNESINNTFEVKRKKKGQNDSIGIDNPNFDNLKDDSAITCHNSDFEIKRKKKKKEESLAIDNPNFDDIKEDSCHDNFEIKRRRKKIENDSFAIDNPNFDNSKEDSVNSCHSNFEVKRKGKKIENDFFAIDNPNFDNSNDCQGSYVDSTFEVTRKKKKREDGSLAIDNPNFDSSNDCQNSFVDSNFEVTRKKKKKICMTVDNPNFEDSLNSSNVSQSKDVSSDRKNSSDRNENKKEDTNSTNEETESRQNNDEPSFDLMLNVTSTPCIVKPESKKKSAAKRRKSVRFSNVNEERIIPNNEDIENRNELFDINSRIIANGLKDGDNTDVEEKIDEISKKIDGFQAEIENDINEAKVKKFIGEVGNPNGENEKLSDGTKLKFKYANFGRTPYYLHKNTSKARTSYKHLIKGDITLGFKNTNLHEIVGYGVKNIEK